MIQITEKIKINTTSENFLAKVRDVYFERFGKHIFETISYSGSNIQTNCPFHSDRKPSFGVKENLVWHCFSCDRSGNAISLIKELFNLSYEEAKQWILETFTNIDISEQSPFESHLEDNQTTYVSENELKKYRFKHPYMYERKLTDGVIDLFDIGYDADFKLISKKDGKEYNVPSITFPVKDIKGRCLFVARRSIQGKIFHYPLDVDKPLYGLYELIKTKTNINEPIFIVESMLDACVLSGYGAKSIALNGLGSETQIEELKKLPYAHYVIATDNDEKGITAGIKLCKKLSGIKFLSTGNYPKGKKDPGEMTEEEIKTFIKESVSNSFHYKI